MNSQAAFGPPFFPVDETAEKGDASLTPALPKSERAVVHADPALSAGLPVSLRLRRVDRRDVPLTASSVELPPGPHQLLVDCRVNETGATRRFTVAAELEPGGEYRLVATASARNCEEVTLQPR